MCIPREAILLMPGGGGGREGDRLGGPVMGLQISVFRVSLLFAAQTLIPSLFSILPFIFNLNLSLLTTPSALFPSPVDPHPSTQLHSPFPVPWIPHHQREFHINTRCKPDYYFWKLIPLGPSTALRAGKVPTSPSSLTPVPSEKDD